MNFRIVEKCVLQFLDKLQWLITSTKMNWQLAADWSVRRIADGYGCCLLYCIIVSHLHRRSNADRDRGPRGTRRWYAKNWMDHNQGAITHLRTSKDTINRHLILRAKKYTCLFAAVQSSRSPTRIIIFNMTIILLRLGICHIIFFLQIVHVLCVLEYLF